MIARLLVTLLILAAGLGAIYLAIYLVRHHPALGIPLLLILLAWGIIASYNAMLKRLERRYRKGPPPKRRPP